MTNNNTNNTNNNIVVYSTTTNTTYWVFDAIVIDGVIVKITPTMAVAIIATCVQGEGGLYVKGFRRNSWDTPCNNRAVISIFDEGSDHPYGYTPKVNVNLISKLTKFIKVNSLRDLACKRLEEECINNNIQFNEDWVCVEDDYAILQDPETGRVLERVSL